MIFKLKTNGEIEIVQNTKENVKEARIKLMPQENFGPEDTFLLYINDKLQHLANGVYNIDINDIAYGENKVEVLWVQKSKRYVLMTNIERYISIGGIKPEEKNQFMLDTLSKIKKLEERIKVLEERGTIVW